MCHFFIQLKALIYKSETEEFLEFSRENEIYEHGTLMKGPGTFPLKSLLTIFQCIASVYVNCIEEEDQKNEEMAIDSNELMSISLPKEGNFLSTIYRCTSTEYGFEDSSYLFELNFGNFKNVVSHVDRFEASRVQSLYNNALS